MDMVLPFVCSGSAGCDMRMGAALILSVGKRQEPLGDVHLLKRDVHDGGNSRIGEPSVTGHGFLFPVIEFRVAVERGISL
jgi:hypothetical protein